MESKKYGDEERFLRIGRKEEGSAEEAEEEDDA